MAQGVLGETFLVVEALGRVHVAVMLADQVRYVALQPGHLTRLAQDGLATGVGEIVEGINVFQQFAAFDAADAAGLAVWVETPGDLIAAGIEVMVVGRLVDAHAPQNNRGPIPVAPDHGFDIGTDLVLPGAVADVLPTGRFLEHQQPQFVAGVQEMARLRVMAGAYQVDVVFVFENLGVAALGAFGHGVADIGPGLVAIQADDGQAAAVQPETVGAEFGLAETDAPFPAVKRLVGL